MLILIIGAAFWFVWVLILGCYRRHGWVRDTLRWFRWGSLLIGILQVGALPVYLVALGVKPNLPPLTVGEQAVLVICILLGAANIATFVRSGQRTREP